MVEHINFHDLQTTLHVTSPVKPAGKMLVTSQFSRLSLQQIWFQLWSYSICSNVRAVGICVRQVVVILLMIHAETVSHRGIWRVFVLLCRGHWEIYTKYEGSFQMFVVLQATMSSFTFSTIRRWILWVNVPDSARFTLGHISRKAAPPEHSKAGLHVWASGASCSSPGAQSELHGWRATWWDLGWLHTQNSVISAQVAFSISIVRSR